MSGKLIALLLVFGVVAGCDSASPVTAAAPPTAPAPEKPTIEPVKADSQPVEPAQDKKPGDNPKRIYQLRELEHATVIANGRKIDAWLMDTEAKGQEGLMWLTDKDIKDNQGGLFVYSDADQRSFWMQNTLIPLDIIYMDPTGKVVSIAHGKALDETSLPSKGPAMYVLELKGGRAEMFGIRPGVTLKIPKNATRKDG